MIAYIIFGIAAVIGIIMSIKILVNFNADKKLVQEMQEKYKNDYAYISDNKTLYIYKNNPKIVKLLSIDNHTISRYSDVPERYIYTGASVGGVTTGGVSKVGGYTDAKTIRTNKCIILMKELSRYYLTDKIVMTEKEVHKICLNSELLEAAKDSPIKEYIVDDKIIVVGETGVSMGTAAMYRTGNTLSAVNTFQKEQTEGYPSFTKCLEIMDWLKENVK